MMLYLTGAQTSLAKSGGFSPQPDVNQSLGGYVSSTPVPNGALNVVFDMISIYTLQNRPTETLAFALINKFDKAVQNVTLKIVTDEGVLADFKVSAVKVGKDMLMEHIANRFEQPMLAEFFDASFYRAGVTVKIITPAIKGEEILFQPMNVVVNVKESGLTGTWDSINEAFEKDETYLAKRLTADTFRIERRDEEVLANPIKCSYVTSDVAAFEYIGDMLNKTDNSVFLMGYFLPGDCIGLWVQRKIRNHNPTTNEQLLINYKDDFNYPTVEEVDFIVEYEIDENYSNDYKKPDYS